VTGVCLGRTPGFKQKDVDRALAISSFDAFWGKGHIEGSAQIAPGGYHGEGKIVSIHLKRPIRPGQYELREALSQYGTACVGTTALSNDGVPGLLDWQHSMDFFQGGRWLRVEASSLMLVLMVYNSTSRTTFKMNKDSCAVSHRDIRWANIAFLKPKSTYPYPFVIHQVPLAAGIMKCTPTP
jgi:hypothetical protein